jgi:hypothetical protein
MMTDIMFGNYYTQSDDIRQNGLQYAFILVQIWDNE